LLGELCHQRSSIAVCGTHGKTTVTGMLYSIFLAAQKSPSCLVGSLMKDFGGRNSIGGDDDTFILEACEYKGNFKNLRPNYALSTNVDFDHCDYFQTEDHYFRTFKSFFSEVPPEGFIVMRVEDSVKVGADYFRCKVFFYDKYVDFLRSCDELNMQVFGEHNYWNAACAYAFAHEYGIDHADIIKGLNSFSGTWRRMEYRGRLSGARVYDDYAHHPTEVRATLSALREKYSDSKIRVVFQPHQFSRTKFFLNDFARSFDDADEVIVPNIYRVRDSDLSAQSVTVDDLVHKLSAYKNDSVRNGEGLKNTSDYIQQSAKDGEVIVLMGAGDVTNVQNNWKLET
jgi:UDP-N-acetylmuramate--alanine ligase